MHESLTRNHNGALEDSALADLIAVLARDGLAWLEGLPDSADLLRLAKSIATVVPHRDSQPNGVTTISDLREAQVSAGFAGFSASALMPHTDRSGVARPPALLMMSCRRPAPVGGECVLVDGKSVYDDLAEAYPEAVRALSTPRSACFGGATGHRGSIFTRASGGRVDIRLRLDELAQFSPEVTRWLPVLRATIARQAITVRVGAGEGYILHNCRWLHGRREFTGRRTMYRVIGNPYPHLAIPSGFHPSAEVFEGAGDLVSGGAVG